MKPLLTLILILCTKTLGANQWECTQWIQRPAITPVLIGQTIFNMPENSVWRCELLV